MYTYIVTVICLTFSTMLFDIIILLNRFVGRSVVVVATKPIAKGEEINNCYGLSGHYRHTLYHCV